MNEIDQILKIIKDVADKYPSQRFGQILFNLNITQFKSPENPAEKNFEIRDNYNDSNEEILRRVMKRKAKIDSFDKNKS